MLNYSLIFTYRKEIFVSIFQKISFKNVTYQNLILNNVTHPVHMLKNITYHTYILNNIIISYSYFKEYYTYFEENYHFILHTSFSTKHQ